MIEYKWLLLIRTLGWLKFVCIGFPLKAKQLFSLAAFQIDLHFHFLYSYAIPLSIFITRFFFFWKANRPKSWCISADRMLLVFALEWENWKSLDSLHSHLSASYIFMGSSTIFTHHFFYFWPPVVFVFMTNRRVLSTCSFQICLQMRVDLWSLDFHDHFFAAWLINHKKDESQIRAFCLLTAMTISGLCYFLFVHSLLGEPTCLSGFLWPAEE